MENLIDGLQREMNRVREMITEYEALPKGAGLPAAFFMKLDIKNAEKAIADDDDDVVEMLRSYSELQKNTG